MTSITVAIPSYNKSAYIRRALESVLANSAAIDKILVIDNCSTDDTFTIAQTYEPKITCVQNKTNLGMTGNFNRCIELCNTDWLMIFHADDEMLPAAIEKYRAAIEKHPSVRLIHADCFFMRDGIEETKELVSRDTTGFFKGGQEAMSCRYGACSAVMVRKDAYQELGNFIESMSTDVEMWARIASRFDLFSIAEPMVVYHVSAMSTGPQSLVNRSVKEIKADWDNLDKHLLALISNETEREEKRRSLFKDGPGSYWPIVTANVRARNWRNVANALKVIVVDYRGIVPLIIMTSRSMFRLARRLVRI